MDIKVKETKFIFNSEESAARFLLAFMGQSRRIDETTVICFSKAAINEALKVATKLPEDITK